MDDIKRIDLVDIELTGGSLHRSWCKHSIGSADALANAFGVRVFRDGEPVNLGGGSVQGFFRDPQGHNIPLTTTGTIDYNVAYVVLTAECYNYEGQFCLAIKVKNTDAGITGTMRIVDGMVDNTHTDNPVVPTESVPDYTDVLAVYEEMLEAKAGSVRFDITQSLTSTQQEKARDNIGAVPDVNVRYDQTQSLTAAQKLQARENIEAASGPEFESRKNAFANQYAYYDHEKTILISWVDGKYYNNQPRTESGWSYTSKIPVDSNCDYVICSVNDSQRLLTFFYSWLDEDGDAVDYGSVQSGTFYGYYKITPPTSSVTHVIISVPTAYKYDFRISENKIPRSPETAYPDGKPGYNAYRKNLLTDAAPTFGKGWTISSGSVSSYTHQNLARFEKIAITQGTVYYLANITSPYTCIEYPEIGTNGTAYKLMNADESLTNDFYRFMAADDGYIYISYDANKCDPSEVYFGTSEAAALMLSRSTNNVFGDMLMKINPNFSREELQLYDLRSNLYDCDLAQNGVLYRIQVISDDYLQNLPSDFPTDGSVFYLFTIVNRYIGTEMSDPMAVQKSQILFNLAGTKRWIRGTVSGGGMSDWVKYEAGSSGGYIFECGTGKTYARLRDAIAAARAVPNSRVIVYPGTYDLTEEFSTEITAAQGNVGIQLSNNVYVEFLAGSYVTALFENSSEWISNSFQPFYAAGSGFTLDGLNIRAQNCRYCVHDERAGADVQYHNVYKNCVMEFTMDDAETSGGTNKYFQCIGGGLGKNGYIEITGGCYTTVNNKDADVQQPISYHNGYSAGCDSKIHVDNVYLADKGQFRFSDYGASTIDTRIYVSNCSMGGQIIRRRETQDTDHDNMVLIEWNNTVRQA